MADEPDDEALRWAGDDDPRLQPVVKGRPPVSAPASTSPTRRVPGARDGARAGAARPAPATGSPTSDGADDGPAPLSNAALIVLGLFSGIALFSSIGWIVGGLRLAPYATDAGLRLDSVGFHIAMWFAVLAPPIWFTVVLVLTRGGRPLVRFTLLTVGAVLLLPWPFLMLGAVGR